jgi:hypothetical protein
MEFVKQNEVFCATQALISGWRAVQVYKGTAHPHDAQQPLDITEKISISNPKLVSY